MRATEPPPVNPASYSHAVERIRTTPYRRIQMFNDKIDYQHPELMPYSDASDAELLYSCLLAAAFAAVFLIALFG